MSDRARLSAGADCGRRGREQGQSGRAPYFRHHVTLGRLRPLWLEALPGHEPKQGQQIPSTCASCGQALTPPDDPQRPPKGEFELGLTTADEASVFQYALKLRYPNGRTFTYNQESEVPLVVGHEFDAFGRRWRIACKVPPTRLSPASLPSPEAFACDPLSESGLRKSERNMTGSRVPAKTSS